jgi:penicillin-binding protein 1A
MENKIKQGSTHTFPLPPKKIINQGFKKWIKYIWTGLAAVVLGIAFLFFAISQGFLGDMPDVQELENPDIYVASEIISSDGVQLGNLRKKKPFLLLTKIYLNILFMH